MNSILICIITTCCIVYIWDYSGFVAEVANEIVSIITKGKITSVKLRKPLGCSLCMSTWITLIVLLCLNWKLAPLCLIFGWSTQYILIVFEIIDLILSKLLNVIQKPFK